jgi:hypothetical protein
MNGTENLDGSCDKQVIKNINADVDFVRTNDDTELKMFSSYNQGDALLAGVDRQKYNRSMPIM